MSAWPGWDAKVEYPNAFGPFALDNATGRRAFYGPDGEPGTPDQGPADDAWGQGSYSGWFQPDGTWIFYLSLYGFNESLLAVLGAPIYAEGLDILQLWGQSEGMPQNSFNPLATMRTGYGEHFQSPYTAPFYPTPYLGLIATNDTLRQSGYGYEPIIGGFQAGRPRSELYSAINSSSWCKGCSGGHYPIALYDSLTPTQQKPPVTVVGPTGTVTAGPGVGASAISGLAGAWQDLKQAFEGDIPNEIGRLQQVAGRSPTG